MAAYYGFNPNISFTFQAVKNLSAHPTYLRFGLFCKFFGDFLVYLGINSFSQRISKIYGNKKFGRFDVVLKLNMLVENPPKWLFSSKNFFRQKCLIFCIWPSISLLNNAFLFFSPICFSFSRKSKPKDWRIVQWCAMTRNKRKSLFKFAV